MDYSKSVLGLRPFLPARDFEVSRAFYRSLGFEEVWTSANLVLFEVGELRFFVQRYYVAEWADNMMLDLRVDSADAFFKHLSELPVPQDLSALELGAPRVDDNGYKFGYFKDPSGVLWNFSED